jgi:hypothetical protein
MTVAKRLGPLRDRIVFVGGMIRGLLVTDPAAGPSRPTDDVDLIVDVASLRDYHALGAELRSLGLHEDMEDGAPICRWILDGVRVDVMPIDPGVLGFSNVWYEGAIEHAAVTNTSEGSIRHLDAPHFCATKLEAFASRAGGDLLHHDLEDFIAVVDERPSLGEEIAKAPGEMREFLAETVAGLLAWEAFRDALPGHLQGDSASQARLPVLMSRLERIAALRSGASTTSPPAVYPPPAAPLLTLPIRASSGTAMPQLDRAAPIERVLLHSSNLRSARYDTATNTLVIEFRSGRVYKYAGVPTTIYEGLLRASSAGRYFNRWIRKRYPYHRI